ncbi:hypothetical protein JOC77_003163 [Peribacillus deserti]|uniref:DUF4030 domain-containing protein n=1 Tax=Peribacillus deserti TaxID=673318 RepID=A0ABS2QLT3_9BACI|nr:DUF4179 domain-containing protein [Peribacillus deserti]MBM7693719.1 hypothetical protein [Peribacillus deserti]
MNEYLSSNVKKEVDKIKIPEDKLEQAIEFAIKRGKKHHPYFGFGKKLINLCSAAVLLLCQFIGSAFVSPAMATVVSKIPYLGQILENKDDIISVIFEELREKGYKVNGSGVSYSKKEIVIRIEGSEKYFDNVKGDVEKIAKDILHSRNYDAYTLKVNRNKERTDEVIPEEEKKRNEFNKQYEIIYNAVTEELKKRDNNILSLGMVYRPKTIEVEIPDTETETRNDEMKQVINQILQSNKMDPIPIKIKKIDMKVREQDRKRMGILNIVEEDILGKKEYKVIMVGYSIHPEPEIQAFISLSSSDDNVKDFAQQLEKVILR